ncbi:MAG: single-stranded DNA-binding protein [Bacteroidetes bacterium]|nr:single-stranded DNA-binding protein [Bacteroidota bacterium]MBM3423986.1 single-stranded DNA-binding protein [Bacteroidota bacterium]
MNQSVNKVILLGNLGRDPEIRHFENGGVVASFSLATSESFMDSHTGERREITDWHDIVAWRGLALVAEKVLVKGARVYVEGRLKKRSYQDKEGQSKTVIEVVAEELVVLSRPEGKNPLVPPYSEVISEQTKVPDSLIEKDDDTLPF